MRVSVLGTGYLGAVHAAGLARLGHQVVAYDTDPAKIAALSAGIPPFYEPGFGDLLSAELQSGRLRFTSDAAEAISGAVAHFICVGTPQQSGSHAADLRYVDSAFRLVADHADVPGVAIGKSTVPVGTAERLNQEIGRDGHLEVAWTRISA